MNKESTKFINHHVSKAIELCGSQAELGRLCNAKQQNVSKWLRMRKVTAEAAVAIEKATNGQIDRYVLRPDLFIKPAYCPNCTCQTEATE